MTQTQAATAKELAAELQTLVTERAGKIAYRGDISDAVAFARHSEEYRQASIALAQFVSANAEPILAALTAPAAPSAEGLVEVRKIETVTGDFMLDPGEPFWRIEIDGFCADFDYEAAANNFAAAINRRASMPTTPATGGTWADVVREYERRILDAECGFQRVLNELRAQIEAVDVTALGEPTACPQCGGSHGTRGEDCMGPHVGPRHFHGMQG